MKPPKIKVGSRVSRLAQIQVKEIFSLLSRKATHLDYTLLTYQTKGDKDKMTSLVSNPADDFFTDTLDQALLSHEIDVAVHSAKDLPQNLKEGLTIFALTASLDETDAFVGKGKLSELKAGAKVGTSSLLRRQMIKDQYPYLEMVDIRGTIEERLAQIKQGKLDGVIVATCALKRLGLEDLIREILPYATTPLQGQLAVVGRAASEELRELFMPIDIRLGYGKVALVGAGPGDPEFISIKAIKALKEADVIFYDYLIDKELLKYARTAEKIYVGKRKGEHTLPQIELCQMLKEKAVQGKDVVRFKGGDPLIFGRGADEISYLQSYHIPVTVVPGISSATGLPSSLGIPLTARGISPSVAFLSGHRDAEDSGQTELIDIPKVETVVFLMGITKLAVIAKSLLAAGWPKETPIIVISQGTTPQERRVLGTIQDIEQRVAQANLSFPALIVVGQTVKFYKKQEAVPENLLYLGTNPERYRSLGHIIHLPMIEITPRKLPAKIITRLLTDLDKYQLIILTSRFAVQYFLKILMKRNNLMAKLRKIDFAVIGGETAQALREFDIESKIVATPETSQGLLRALVERYDLRKMNILFPRSALLNPFLKKKLAQKGASVKELAVYDNKKPAKRDLPRFPIHKILFTSPSTVKNFIEHYGTIPLRWQILSKGPLTSQALKKAGYDSEMLIDNKGGNGEE